MEMVHFIPTSQRKIVLKAAQDDLRSVLIAGENGTGKGAISRWIHKNGPRAGKPFLTYTREKPFSDQLVLAHGGTLEINEIGEWSLTDQLALLSLLKNKMLPKTASEPIQKIINIRIIATTSQSLEGRASSGLFEADLLVRLSQYRIEMPSLRDRKEEFEDIIEGILGEITTEVHKEHLSELSPESFKKLVAYSWPGNLRELRNVLRMAVIKATGSRVEESDVPDLNQNKVSFSATRKEFEKIYLQELLKSSGKDLSKVARLLNLDVSQIEKKLIQYKIDFS